MRALAHGLPMLCLPMGRDQNDNAARVARAERACGSIPAPRPKNSAPRSSGWSPNPPSRRMRASSVARSRQPSRRTRSRRRWKRLSPSVSRCALARDAVCGVREIWPSSKLLSLTMPPKVSGPMSARSRLFVALVKTAAQGRRAGDLQKKQPNLRAHWAPLGYRRPAVSRWTIRRVPNVKSGVLTPTGEFRPHHRLEHASPGSLSFRQGRWANFSPPAS